MNLTPELIKLIASYLIGLVILGFAGYSMVTTGEVPREWMALASAVVGAVFVGNGIASTVRYRNQRKDK